MREVAGTRRAHWESHQAASNGRPPIQTGRDGRYIAFSNAIVIDTKTGLEWIAGLAGT